MLATLATLPFVASARCEDICASACSGFSQPAAECSDCEGATDARCNGGACGCYPGAAGYHERVGIDAPPGASLRADLEVGGHNRTTLCRLLEDNQQVETQ